MKMDNDLNITGFVLDKNQLFNLFEKIADEHIIQNKSKVETFPIKILKKSYYKIIETYNLLNKHIKLGIRPHSAGEWLLDNFYIIEENYKVILNELSKKKYRNLKGIAVGEYKGVARIYLLAKTLVAYTDNNVNEENIRIALTAYQKKKILSLEEIYYFGVFIKIAEIISISKICEKIISSQNQKYRVEIIIENVIDKKKNSEKIFGKKFDINYSQKSELKYPFIEYMSYKLKKYGKDAVIFQNILEQEVEKIGYSVSEVITKEHTQIANCKVMMGNCIISLKNISRINFNELLNEVSGLENMLKQDPANIYDFMDQETKSYYRNKIEKIAKKYKVSELYVTSKILELANSNINDEKKSHVGYYLLKDGYYELLEKLEVKKIRKISLQKLSRLYVAYNIVIPLFIDGIFSVIYGMQNSNLLMVIFLFVILYIPITEIYIRITNYILGKLKKPTLIPKMNFEEEIPEEYTTMVVIPTILNSAEKVEKLFKKLEVYYLANKQKNIYFTLLGDCTESDSEFENKDKEIINKGKEIVEQLNNKYNENLFGFLYRKRCWNSGEQKFIGWERKRGLLYAFNRLLEKNENDFFVVNTLENDLMKKVKYVITLDSDTNLIYDSASKLIGAMAHVLNKPVIKNNKVIDGYGIMQPRVGMDLDESRKSKFVKIYSGQGGIDFYTNAMFDIYQDYFKEGIFTGKGIYDLNVYNQILKNEIPENLVLSHDLLEGNYLRCGLISDVELLDGYPSKYLAYIKRNHRWVRGDWQITKWLFYPKMNTISKFKIYDNMRRSLLKIFVLIGIVFSIITKNEFLFIMNFFGLEITYILEFINYIVNKRSKIIGSLYSNRNFSRKFGNNVMAGIKMILDFLFLPTEAIDNLDAIIRVFYRKYTKQKMLEWQTSEDSERLCLNSIGSYYKKMWSQILIGIVVLYFNNYLLGFLWIIAPIIAWYISFEENKKETASEEERKYLKLVASEIWRFYEDYINEENNYLIIDNYQEDRKNKIVQRTSSTNIGLELLSIISAYDMGFIDKKKCVEYLEKIIFTINKLSKWNGHLFNWYNTKTLEPLIPRYVSTVDSGNFVGYLFVVKQFLIENLEIEGAEILLENVEKIINDTDFGTLYSYKNKLFSVGYNLEENKLTDSYYDFLASEARQASVVAIAKRDVPLKHWNNLSRTLTVYKGYKGLVSWTGTAFEYLMPNINLKNYEGSLIDEASKFAIMSQKNYCSKFNIPWGISESAYNTKDFNYNYQYKAFGIPWLGLKRGLEEDLVISPYSTFLALRFDVKDGIENLRKIEKLKARGKYGFYEAIDFTPKRLKFNRKYAVVKTYMAHHQGLSFNSINNVLNDNILEKRFNENSCIEAVNILLQERMPLKMILTKENKKKVHKLKESNNVGVVERIVENDNYLNRKFNVLSNSNYKVIIDNFGCGYSEYNGKLVNEYKDTNFGKQGIFFVLKKDKRINFIEKNSVVKFGTDKVSFEKAEGSIESKLDITIDTNNSIEIRNLEIYNTGNQDEVLELFCYFIPILSNNRQHYAHPAFNKMFLNYEIVDNCFVITRKTRNNDEKCTLVVALYTESSQIVEKSFEISKERFFGRDNVGIPTAIENGTRLTDSINKNIDSCLALKEIFKIRSKEKIRFCLIMSIDEEKDVAINNLKQKLNEEEIKKSFELAKNRSEEEIKYSGLDYNQIINCMKITDFLYLPKIEKRYMKFNGKYEYNMIWKYGISGDYPIILFELKRVDDVFILEEFLNIFQYLRLKNIFMDIVILTYEENIYEQSLKNEINYVIDTKQLGFLKYQNGGIYIINYNEMTNEEYDFLRYIAKIRIDSKKGRLENYLIEKEHEQPDVINVENEKFEEEVLELNNQNLEFYNGYGGFQNNGKEYVFHVNKMNKIPSVWSNVISNKYFGVITTENILNSMWSKNCRLNRLTSWCNNEVENEPSEIIYIVDKYKKRMWSLNSGVMPNDNYYYITHGLGYSKFRNITDGLIQEITVFVPIGEKNKVIDFRIKNINDENRKLDFIYFINLVLGEDEYYTKDKIFIKAKDGIIYFKNAIQNECFKDELFYIKSSEKFLLIGDKKESLFVDNDLKKPIRRLKEIKINEEKNYADSCNADCFIGCLGIDLKAFEEKRIVIETGVVNENELVNGIIEDNENEMVQDNKGDDKNEIVKEIKSRDKIKFDQVEKKLEKVNNYWGYLLSGCYIQTSSLELNYLINGWIPYQTISSRMFARNSFYQCGGAYGFRDQLQDCIGMKFLNSEFLRNQIINSARHQFEEGDVLHWWHEENKSGIRTKFSDDLLWLPYAVIEYVEYENDYNVLDEEIEYVVGDLLNDNEQEKFGYYYCGKNKDSLYMHCIKAIEKSLNFGEHGLPKIGCGDWNDGFNYIGKDGRGESIWLGFFLYDILNRFVGILEYKNDIERIEKYKKICEGLKQNLNTFGWDGKWYKRAIDDSGNVIGSMESDECKIDSISQSWAIISNAGDNDKKYICLESVQKYLVDRENKLIKLFSPGFENSKIEPGYVKSYPNGVRENGGQYTHGVLWIIMAYLRLGLGDEAYELLELLNPIEHSKTNEMINIYKKEPYVIAADVYSTKGMEGRGGWTWYTGSSSWFYKIVIEEMLGLKIKNGYMEINPCIPKKWRNCEIKFKYKTCMYNIKITNKDFKNTDVKQVLVDGIEVKNKKIFLENNRKIYTVEIIM